MFEFGRFVLYLVIQCNALKFLVALIFLVAINYLTCYLVKRITLQT